MSGQDLIAAYAWIALLLAIALLLPNSLQLLQRHGPALGKARPAEGPFGWLQRAAWAPDLRWAAFVCVLAVSAVMRLGGDSEFLYWQF